MLDIFDFLCFQNSFVAGEPYACNCDTTAGADVCDVFDFLCFQSAFVGGCPQRSSAMQIQGPILASKIGYFAP